ncbi:MAG: hypothetical protein U0794_22115 [Isosphaeraceae bacterium]
MGFDPPYRMTTLRWMIVVAVASLALATPAAIRDPMGERLILGSLAILAIVGGLDLLVSSFIGMRCPQCGRWTLARMARYPRHFRCRVCRARVKRVGLARWVDASGPEEAVCYRAASESRPWLGYEYPEDAPESTTGRLLAGKRRANPAAPPASPPKREGSRPGRPDLAATLREISEAVKPSRTSP